MVRPLGGVAERLKAPVLKTGKGLVPFVGSNPTPTVAALLNRGDTSRGRTHRYPRTRESTTQIHP